MKRIVNLFVDGDLSLIGEDECSSLSCFRPLAVRLCCNLFLLALFTKQIMMSLPVTMYGYNSVCIIIILLIAPLTV